MFLKYQQPTSRKFREEGESGEGASVQDGVQVGQESEGDDNGLSEIQAKLDQLAQENARLSAKISEANKHKREAEKAAAEEARKKAEAEGNYEQLFNSSEAARQEEAEKVAKLQQQITEIKLSEVAGSLASKLDPIPQAVDDLKQKIASRLKYTDDGVKVLDKDGNLTVSTFDQLAEELRGSADVSYMLKGNQSSGGGASGSDRGSASKSKKSGDMSRGEKAQFIAEHGLQAWESKVRSE